MTACEVLRYYWKLKAIESIQVSAPGCARLLEEEFSKLVDTLIDDPKIKNLVMKAIPHLANSQRYLLEHKQEEHDIKVLSRMLCPSTNQLSNNSNVMLMMLDLAMFLDII